MLNSVLPYSFVKRHHVIAVADQQDGITKVLYTKEPSSKILIELRRFMRQQYQLENVERERFDEMVRKIYESSQNNDLSNLEDGLVDDIGDLQTASQILADEPTDLLESADSAPIIRFLNALISQAVRNDASDIHFEPYENRVRVRFRVNGTLREMLELKTYLGSLVTSRIKVMAKIDIAERRVPQDGRITIRIGGRTLDLRISTIPIERGEKIAIRLLENHPERFNLHKLGMPEHIRKAIEDIPTRSYGIFLVAGPTGAGKTTTLYATLSRINTRDTNVMTVEDPVEYHFDGINQTQVNIQTGMSFSKGLRAILRQDPDVILVGEIRDEETAEIAVQASLTGHLVLSTIHTNTASGAVTRLLDMKIPSFLISSGLKGVLAQRLVRTLCPDCKIPYQANEYELRELNLEQNTHTTLYRENGCEKCSQSGFIGRTGLYELMIVSDQIKELISEKVSEHKISEVAIRPEDTLRNQGIVLAIKGETTLTEVLRSTEV